MRITFPILASLLLACCGEATALLAQVAPSSPAAAVVPRAAAEEALHGAIAALDRYETVTAKVRQRAEVLGKAVSGAGTYVQGPPRYNLVRLEMSLQVDDRACSLLQICDGKQLWIQRDSFGSMTLTCLDAQKVLAARQKKDTSRPTAATDGLALGGLPRVLRELDRSFQFEQLPDAKLGTLAVRVLRGQWRPDRWSRFLPDQAAALAAGKPAELSKLPPHAPDEVLLYLGRDDLFPYRLECRRISRPEDIIGRDLPPMSFALEFYEVHVNSAVDPLTFVYTPGTARYTDETDLYLLTHPQ